MSIEVMSVERLRFDDGAPVRAASAVVAFAGGFLVVPDDATHAAWFRGSSVTAVRLLPPTGGHELFSDATGTKHLKPDLEAACHLTVEGGPAALIMGSGSSPARMRWVLLRLEHGEPRPHVADMTPLYASVADALSLRPEDLNLEGVCVVGDVLRWYQRGIPSAGLPSGSVDLDLRTAVAAALGQVGPAAAAALEPRTYDLGAVAGVGLAITDVVTLPDGTLLASAAAEDSPNPRDDGPVVASCLVRLDDTAVREVIPLPPVEDSVIKVEGLMVLEGYQDGALLLAVADVDDPDAASLATRVRVRF
ncbi:DUF6910 family protein [Nocardioides pantholopis]|uniref:DUF6910 family protein n=1 Tax=Nocardioides pantholopis TaxID=2483798 RepID=UPI0019D16B4D|nr:hypothetical protein [Nocardioides pantholopis]